MLRGTCKNYYCGNFVKEYIWKWPKIYPWDIDEIYKGLDTMKDADDTDRLICCLWILPVMFVFFLMLLHFPLFYNKH